jgi:hypothetical protein
LDIRTISHVTKAKRITNVRSFILGIGGVLAVACGCQSSSPKIHSSAVRERTAATTQLVVSPSFTWPIPPDFPSFGVPTKDSIRVAIFGYSVKQPGYYYLARGATVHAAMQAAHFSGFVWWQRPYCGIQRQRSDGSVETIWFAQINRAADEQRILQNNDRIRISHEVY